MSKRRISKREIRVQRGFTIIELLVSMTLFVVITSIAVTSFVRSLRAQQAIVALTSVNDNAGLTLEQMARELRTGSNFSAIGTSILEFDKGVGGTRITYQLNTGTNQIERREENGAAVPLTASNVRINRLRFLVLTKDPETNTPIAPRVVIGMQVGSYARDLSEVYTNIQTTVSPRNLNF